jgi:phospholipid-binding lipoprotein MlaA
MEEKMQDTADVSQMHFAEPMRGHPRWFIVVAPLFKNRWFIVGLVQGGMLERASPSSQCIDGTYRASDNSRFSDHGLQLQRWLRADRIIAASLFIMSMLALVACAHAPKDPEARAAYERTNDPAEPTNRKIFAGNQFVDHHAVQPVARGYENYVPSRVQKSIHNFADNLSQPGVAVNDILQGNVSRAWNTAQRFGLNTTIGGLGLFDVATDWDRPGHSADFGQTLGVWGVGSGPAVQLPLLGPSNVRDSVGKIVDFATKPTNYVPGGAVATVSMASTGLGAVDSRAQLLPTTDMLEKSSLDYYAATRSVAAQHRAALVSDGKQGLVVDPRNPTTPPVMFPEVSGAAEN